MSIVRTSPSADHLLPVLVGSNLLHRLGLRANFFWSLSGNLISGASQVLVLVLIAALTNTTAVGEYALAVAIVNPLIALGNMQLRSVQASDSRNDYAISLCLITRLITTGIVALLVVSYAGWQNEGVLLSVLVAVLLTRGLVSISDVLYGAMQRHERMDFIAKSQVLSMCLQVFALATVLSLTGRLVPACYAMALAAFIVIWTYDRPRAKLVGMQRARKPSHRLVSGLAIRRLVWFALPLGFVTGVVTVTANIPRYALGLVVDHHAVGVFAILACPGLILQQSALALSQASLPRFGLCCRQLDVRGFTRLLTRVVLINASAGATAVVLSFLFGRMLLSRVFGEEFAQYHSVFLFVTIAFAINSVGALGGVLTAARRFRTQFAISVATLTVMVWASFVWIPTEGLMGAALAFVLAVSVRVLLILAAIFFVWQSMHRKCSESNGIALSE